MGPFLCPTHFTTIHYSVLADSTVGCTELNFPPLLWESSYFWFHKDDSETLIPQSHLPWHRLHINNEAVSVTSWAQQEPGKTADSIFYLVN